MSEMVLEFDKNHILYKNFQYDSSKVICQNIQSTFRPQLKEIARTAKNAVKEWEKDYFEKHLYEPTCDDMNDNIKSTMIRYKHAQSLIKHWRVT